MLNLSSDMAFELIVLVFMLHFPHRKSIFLCSERDVARAKTWMINWGISRVISQISCAQRSWFSFFLFLFFFGTLVASERHFSNRLESSALSRSLCRFGVLHHIVIARSGMISSIRDCPLDKPASWWKPREALNWQRFYIFLISSLPSLRLQIAIYK